MSGRVIERIAVRLHAADPVLHSGTVALLRTRPEVLLLDQTDTAEATVAVAVVDRVGNAALQVLKAARHAGSKVVLVVSDVEPSSFNAAVEVGIVGVVRRCDATSDRLVSVIQKAAAGEGSLPADLLGWLLTQVGLMQQHRPGTGRPGFTEFADRELDVLRLLSEGFETTEIALKLSYSERTVKNIVHDITSRLHLRNRAHAVAYALRQGLL